MSGPNTEFDPKQVAALDAQAIDSMVAEALTGIAEASNLDELKAAKTAHTGDRSPLALANREIGALPPAAKADAGKRVGQARAQVKSALEDREQILIAERDAQVLQAEAVDVTLPVQRNPIGGRHPLTTLMERMADVFISMGYDIAEGPEAEAEWANFDALNVPPDHPARTMQDTFYVESPDSGVVLRTQTSPIQIRAMLERDLPIYVVAPGRVYRTDELDATHTPVFHQIEGLAVDEDLTMADLKGTLDHLATQMFGEGIVTRLRPSYFPVHRTQCRSRPRVLRLPRCFHWRSVQPLPHLRQRRLDRMGRLRHGQPACPASRGHRHRVLPRLRLRNGY
jgi:phenylalanyl-tRNA synthetase alpha chain